MISQPTPLVYAITDRRILPRKSASELADLREFIASAIAAEVDLLQIRERDLPARDLLWIADAAAEMAAGSKTKILINDRSDIAACAAVGVHLTTKSIDPTVVRSVFGHEMLIGASTHSLQEASAAATAGADFIVFGPVFETESKRQYGPPVGIEQLAKVTSVLGIPVLALGGIDENNFRRALGAGADGIAGISLFARADNLIRVVRTIKQGAD